MATELFFEAPEPTGLGRDRPQQRAGGAAVAGGGGGDKGGEWRQQRHGVGMGLVQTGKVTARDVFCCCLCLLLLWHSLQCNIVAADGELTARWVARVAEGLRDGEGWERLTNGGSNGRARDNIQAFTGNRKRAASSESD